MTRLEEINELIKKLSNQDIQIGETDVDFGYIIDGSSPTIVDHTIGRDVFALNHPRFLLQIPKLSQYCDRVQVSIFETDENIERIARIMKSEAQKFKSKNGTHSNDYGFEVPGLNGKFCREIDGTNNIELRYYIQTFTKL